MKNSETCYTADDLLIGPSVEYNWFQIENKTKLNIYMKYFEYFRVFIFAIFRLINQPSLSGFIWKSKGLKGYTMLYTTFKIS